MVSHTSFRTTWGYIGKWKLSTKLLWPKLVQCAKKVWQQFVHHCVVLKEFDVGAWFSGVFRKNVLLWDMWTTASGSQNVKNNLMKIIFINTFWKRISIHLKQLIGSKFELQIKEARNLEIHFSIFSDFLNIFLIIFFKFLLLFS